MKTRTVSPLRDNGLRLCSIIMLAAMILSAVPAEPAVASQDYAQRESQLASTPNQVPLAHPLVTVGPAVGLPLAVSPDLPNTPSLAEYPPPQIAISDDPDPVGVNSPLAYTIVVTNPLDSPVGGFVVTDTLPSGVSFVSVTPTSCSQDSGTIVCNLGTINAHATETVAINITSPSTPGIITNHAHVVDARGLPANDSEETYVQPSDLEITKTDEPDPAEMNDLLTYTITITNHGPFTAQNLILTDTLPAGAIFDSASAECTETIPDTQVICTLSSLTVDATHEFQIGIFAPPGNICNQAFVSTLNPDPNPANNTVEEWTAVQQVDLQISKSDYPSFVLVGDPLTYTLVVTNNSALVAPSVVITDALPAEVEFVSAVASPGSCGYANGVVTCTIGDLTPAATAVVEIVVTPIALPPDGPLYMMWRGTDKMYRINPLTGANMGMIILPYVGYALDVDPTTGILYAIMEYDELRYLMVLNPQTGAATPIGSTEYLPGNHLIDDITFDDDGTLWAVTQGNALLTVDKTTGEVTVKLASTGGTYPQTIAWNPDDGLLYNLYGTSAAMQTIHPITSATTPVPLSGDIADFEEPGSLEYDLNARLFVAGELTDDPAEFFYIFANGTVVDRGNLPKDSLASGMVKYTNDISNHALVSSAGAETTPEDNQAEVDTTVDTPELTINKTGNPEHVDLAATLTYTLLIENISPYTSTGVVVTDTLPTGVAYQTAEPSQGDPCNEAGGIVSCAMGTINPYASAMVTITVTSPHFPGTITNLAEAVDDRIAYAQDSEDTLVEPVDLILTKIDDNDPTEGQRTLTYTISILNNITSTYAATGVVVTDTLPGSVYFLKAIPSQNNDCQFSTTPSSQKLVICNLGEIAPGGSATVEIGVEPQSPGIIYNEATVASANTELVIANNTEGETTSIEFPQLQVVISDDPDPADPASPLTYTIRITNTSVYAALGVEMENTLPQGMIYNSASASQGSGCSELDGLVTCHLDTIVPSASAIVTITVTTPITPGVYTNQAEAIDDRIAYAYDSEHTPVAPANLIIVKRGDPEPVLVGLPLTYTIVVTNTGPYEAQNVVISDTLPEKVAFHSLEASIGTCQDPNSQGTILCEIGNLAVDSSASVEIIVTPVDIPPPGILLSVEKDSRKFRWLDQETGETICRKLMLIPIPDRGAFALDFNPQNQFLYGVVRIGDIPGNGHLWLVHIILPRDVPKYGCGQIDEGFPVTPLIDFGLEDSGYQIVDIAFDDSGTLWAVTGTRGTYPNSLVTVDIALGTVTWRANTGAGNYRQALAYNSDDGLLYNYLAWKDSFDTWHSRFQTIDPLAMTITEIPLSGYPIHYLVGSLEYDMGQRNFILGEFNLYPPQFVRLTASGVATRIGPMGGGAPDNNHYSDGLAISPPILNNYAYVSALNPDLFPANNTYREPTEPLVHPHAATLGDRVWEDLDGDGIQDDGEPGLADVTVHLYKQGWGLLNTTTTDANGVYTFTHLIPVTGTYTVTFELPPDYLFAPQNAAGDDNLDSDVDPVTGVSPLITPENDQVIHNLDAGMYRLASVGDCAWRDLDRDGYQDASEIGFPGIDVSLYNTSATLIASTTTASDGSYSFTDLLPGVYWLKFTVPQGYGFTPQDQINDTVDNDADPYGDTALFNLVSGLTDVNRDAGIASHPASDMYFDTAPEPVNEGSSLLLNGGYHDPDYGDLHTVGIDWGDGITSSAVVSGIFLDYVFTATHVYSDGADSFPVTVRIEDQFGNSATLEGNATVENISPTLSLSGNSTSTEGVAYNLGISALTEPGNDTLNACALDWGDGTSPANCLSVIGSTIQHTFPNGPETFTVSVDLEDEDGYYTAVDWIAVNVANAPPVGVNDTYATSEDTTLTIPAPGVLGNDKDVAADPMTAVRQTNPASGTLVFNANGSFTYTPAPDFNGSVSFTYKASDGLESSSATQVTILVGAVNDPPVVEAGPDQQGVEGSSFTFSGSYTDIGMRLGDETYQHTNAPTIIWNFGDGQTAEGNLEPTHAYANNGIYQVILTVTDELGGIGTDILEVSVTNADPIIDPLPDLQVASAAPLTVTVTFTDPGWLDAHTLSIDWGDSDQETVELTAGTFTYDFGHTYLDINIYTVSVTVEDKDNGQDSRTFLINVSTPRTYLPLTIK